MLPRAAKYWKVPTRRWLAATLAVGALFFALWFGFLPRWLSFIVEMAGAARWRWIAVVPSGLGCVEALRCVWDFGWTGHGTPAPMAPLRRLVVAGFYCYVRNPMYVGFGSGLDLPVACIRPCQPRCGGCRRGRCPLLRNYLLFLFQRRYDEAFPIPPLMRDMMRPYFQGHKCCPGLALHNICFMHPVRPIVGEEKPAPELVGV